LLVGDVRARKPYCQVFSDPAPLQAEPLAPNEREAALLNGDSPECHKPIVCGTADSWPP
jgi:hypothetical protein